MRSFWSRAGHTRRRGCRACSTAVAPLGRRATGAAKRRKATFAEIFTACYSSVFATAAIVDAVRKDDRRRELDRQLEEARRELSELQDQSSSASSNAEPETSTLTIHQMDVLWKSLKTIYTNRPFMKEIHQPATISASELIEDLKREHFNAVDESSLRVSRQIDYEQLERAIIAEEGGEQISSRESRNLTQLRRESLSTERLVQILLKRVERLDQDTTHSPSFNEVQKLVTEGYPKFSFRSIDPQRATSNTSTLNRQIRALIGTTCMSLKERIGRVCYNLLVSAHPPDMHTYNTLIAAFDKSGHFALSDALVYSFFHDRLLKPTPSTFTALLNHYKCTENHGQFLRSLACITGLDKRTGGKMTRRHVDDIKNYNMLQQWAKDTRQRTCTGAWVWEHVPLNVPLVETILSGLLHFRLFDDAATFFISCIQARVTLSTRAIKQVFDECVSALDWRAAVRLVRGLANSKLKWEALLSHEDPDTVAYLVERTCALVELCGLGSAQPSSRQYLARLNISGNKLNRLLESLAKTKLLRLRPNPSSFYVSDIVMSNDHSLSRSRLLQLESLSKEFDYIRKTTNSIESKLLYPDFSSSFRASMALQIGIAAVERSVKLSQEFEGCLPRSRRLLHPPSVQVPEHRASQYEALAEDMVAMDLHCEWTDPQGKSKLHHAVAINSLAELAGTKEQAGDDNASERPHFKRRVLFTWSQPSNRSIYSEGKQWAMGS